MGANSSKGSGGGAGAAVGAVANRQITRKAGPQKEDLFTCVTYSILAGASSSFPSLSGEAICSARACLAQQAGMSVPERLVWRGAESTLSDTAFPYWPKKERKLKHRHPVLVAELRALHADVICLQASSSAPLPAILPYQKPCLNLRMQCMPVFQAEVQCQQHLGFCEV